MVTLNLCQQEMLQQLKNMRIFRKNMFLKETECFNKWISNYKLMLVMPLIHFPYLKKNPHKSNDILILIYMNLQRYA